MEHAAETVPAQDAAGSTGPVGRGTMRVALRQLGPLRLLFLAAAAAVLLGFFAYLLFRVAEQDYALLYAGLGLEDAAEITGRLDSQNIPYRLRDDGATILVPASDALRLRMSLAEEGLPRGGSVGYEIFDELSAFGTTNFLADMNLRRALEGELARTISSLNDVRAARVHLVMPKRELFRRERIEPSASVSLRMARGGKPGSRQVLAIQHLVAAAPPGARRPSTTRARAPFAIMPWSGAESAVFRSPSLSTGGWFRTVVTSSRSSTCPSTCRCRPSSRSRGPALTSRISAASQIWWPSYCSPSPRTSS